MHDKNNNVGVSHCCRLKLLIESGQQLPITLDKVTVCDNETESSIVVGPRPQTSRQVTSTEQPPLTEDKAECDDVIELPRCKRARANIIESDSE